MTPPAPGPVAAPWRVATWNIRHGLGADGRVDLVRTAREIAALGADVIGLQEVDVAFGERSHGEDQAARLAALLGLEVAFGAALEHPPTTVGAPPRRYGVALLTRHHLETAQHHRLPAHPAAAPGEPRAVLVARVRRADGAALDVLVTHLDHADPRHRTAQVQGLVRRTDELDPEVPAVLMGDLNADPAAPELAALAATGWQEAAASVRAADEPRPPASRRRGLLARRARTGRAARVARALVRGARLVLRGGLVGARTGRPPAPDAPTHPSRLPLRRLDSMWVRGPIEVRAVRVGPRGSSDHRPVLALLAPRR